jgi:hypothetical protein
MRETEESMRENPSFLRESVRDKRTHTVKLKKVVIITCFIESKLSTGTL